MVIAQNREDFNFMRSFAKKKLAKIFESTVTMNLKMVGCQLLYIVEKYLNSAKLVKDKHFLASPI